MQGKELEQFTRDVINSGSDFVGGAQVVKLEPEEGDARLITVQTTTFQEIRQLQVKLGELGWANNDHHPDRTGSEVSGGRPVDEALVCVRSLLSARHHSYRVSFEDPLVT